MFVGFIRMEVGFINRKDKRKREKLMERNHIDDERYSSK
jgi:hypothetical protein